MSAASGFSTGPDLSQNPQRGIVPGGVRGVHAGHEVLPPLALGPILTGKIRVTGACELAVKVAQGPLSRSHLLQPLSGRIRVGRCFRVTRRLARLVTGILGEKLVPGIAGQLRSTLGETGNEFVQLGVQGREPGHLDAGEGIEFDGNRHELCLRLSQALGQCCELCSQYLESRISPYLRRGRRHAHHCRPGLGDRSGPAQRDEARQRPQVAGPASIRQSTR